MGNVNNPESMKTKIKCPYGCHINTNHISEIDICEKCNQIRICDVTCESPFNSKLHRICNNCKSFKK